MEYLINHKMFNNGIYKINNEINILLFSHYIPIWFNDAWTVDNAINDNIERIKSNVIDNVNIGKIIDDENKILYELKKHHFNNNNCLIIELNLSGDEYLILWDIKNHIFYDMDCNDKFVEMDDTRFINCLILGICDDVVIWNYDNVSRETI